MITALAQQVYAQALAAAPLADPVPNPAPVAPPGFGNAGSNIVSWFKYGGLICCVVGLIVCGMQMAIGRRNRSEMSAQGAIGVPWVGAGIIIIGAASAIVSGLQ